MVHLGAAEAERNGVLGASRVRVPDSGFRVLNPGAAEAEQVERVEVLGFEGWYTWEPPTWNELSRHARRSSDMSTSPAVNAAASCTRVSGLGFRV